jgi:hypothetical protein
MPAALAFYRRLGLDIPDGYEGFRAPYLTSFGMWFAMVRDPDGNTPVHRFQAGVLNILALRLTPLQRRRRHP